METVDGDNPFHHAARHDNGPLLTMIWNHLDTHQQKRALRTRNGDDQTVAEVARDYVATTAIDLIEGFSQLLLRSPLPADTHRVDTSMLDDPDSSDSGYAGGRSPEVLYMPYGGSPGNTFNLAPTIGENVPVATTSSSDEWRPHDAAQAAPKAEHQFKRIRVAEPTGALDGQASSVDRLSTAEDRGLAPAAATGGKRKQTHEEAKARRARCMKDLRARRAAEKRAAKAEVEMLTREQERLAATLAQMRNEAAQLRVELGRQ